MPLSIPACCTQQFSLPAARREKSFASLFKVPVCSFFSTLVFDELERNLGKKAPESLAFLSTFRSSPIVNIVKPSASLIEHASRIVVAKDAPIVAAAAQARCHYLVTFDRVHILAKREQIKISFGTDVVLPEELLIVLRTAR